MSTISFQKKGNIRIVGEIYVYSVYMLGTRKVKKAIVKRQKRQKSSRETEKNKGKEKGRERMTVEEGWENGTGQATNKE